MTNGARLNLFYGNIEIEAIDMHFVCRKEAVLWKIYELPQSSKNDFELCEVCKIVLGELPPRNGSIIPLLV